jgi:hypothetical protein
MYPSEPKFPVFAMTCAAAVCLSVVAHGVTLAKERSTDKEVIDRLRQALSRYDNVEFTALAQTRSSGSDGSSRGETFTERHMLFRHAGSRVLSSVKWKFVSPAKELPSYWQSDAIVHESGDVQSLFAPLDSLYQHVQGDSRSTRLILYSERLAGVQQRNRESVLRMPTEFGPVVWNIGGFGLLEHLDSAASLSIKHFQDRALLNLESELGSLELSLSNRYGWLPQAFKLVTKPEHITVGGTLRDVFAEGSIEVLSRVWEGEVKEFATDRRGQWYAKEIRFSRISRHRNHPEGVTAIETRVEDLGFTPVLRDKDFRSDIVVPVGHMVSIDGASHLPYRWDGKKAVPDVPVWWEGNAIGNLSDRPGTRVLLIVFNVLLLLIVSLILLRRHQAKR